MRRHAELALAIREAVKGWGQSRPGGRHIWG